MKLYDGLTDHEKENIHKKRKHDKRKLNRRNNKIKYVKMLGGECCICGYKKYLCSLDFHHKNPKEKTIGSMYINNYLRFCKVKKEVEDEILNKCVVVCSNCHRHIHATEENKKVFDDTISKIRCIKKPKKKKIYIGFYENHYNTLKQKRNISQYLNDLLDRHFLLEVGK